MTSSGLAPMQHDQCPHRRQGHTERYGMGGTASEDGGPQSRCWSRQPRADTKGQAEGGGGRPPLPGPPPEAPCRPRLPPSAHSPAQQAGGPRAPQRKALLCGGLRGGEPLLGVRPERQPLRARDPACPASQAPAARRPLPSSAYARSQPPPRDQRGRRPASGGPPARLWPSPAAGPGCRGVLAETEARCAHCPRSPPPQPWGPPFRPSRQGRGGSDRQPRPPGPYESRRIILRRLFIRAMLRGPRGPLLPPRAPTAPGRA